MTDPKEAKPTQKHRGGNCRQAALSCKICPAGTMCVICHRHGAIRGGCADCPSCEACQVPDPRQLGLPV